MTSSDIWRLCGAQGQFRLGELSGAIDISRPGHGLHELEIAGQSCAQAQLLSVYFQGEDRLQSQTVADAFVRGRDLVVTYAQLQSLPVRLQICYRLQSADQIPGCVAAVDLQISVQTSLLHAWPALSITTRWPSRDVTCYQRRDEQLVAVSDVSSGEDSGRCWSCNDSAGLVRYLEMVHPADVEREAIASHDANSCEIAHQLFAQSLEKGVIIRARARGAFLAATADLHTAAAVHAQFLSAPLPLTT